MGIRNKLSENRKQRIVQNFLNLFQKKFPNYYNQVIEKLYSAEFMIEPSDNSSALARYTGSIVCLSDSLDLEDEYTKHILNHELFHLLSYQFESTDPFNENSSSTYGVFSHYPDSYLKKLIFSYYHQKGIYNFDIDDEFKKFHDAPWTFFLSCFYPFEEACTEFLNSYMANLPKSNFISFKSSPMYISVDKIGSGYDFNVSLIEMLSNVVGTDQILKMQLGNITIGDFFTGLDEKYSDCIVNKDDEFVGFELLRCMCNITPGNADVRADSDNYICASTLIMRAFHKEMKSNPPSSLSEVKKLYNKIKSIQSCMAFDIFSNYDNRPDILEMNAIQNDFLEIASKFTNFPEIEDMKTSIDFRSFIPFSDEYLNNLQTIYNAKDYSVLSKDVIGKYTVPKNSSGDCRNNLYAILEKISTLPGTNGITGAYLDENLKIPKIAQLISKLPSNISSIEDVLKYKKIEDTLVLMATSVFISKSNLYSTVSFFENFNNLISCIYSNSIFDCEYGKSETLKRLELEYSNRLSKIIKSVKDARDNTKNPNAVPYLDSELKELDKLKLSSSKIPEEL